MNPPSNPKNHDATSPSTQNDQIHQTPNSSTTDLPSTYDRKISHAAEVKFINDRYVTPVTVEFGSSDSDSSVNLPVKHRKLFAALKLLDPSLSITINNITYNHPGEFPMGTTYTENFDVIVDKKPRYPRFFVHHDIQSKLKLTALKFGDHNIMSTLQSLNTWLNFNRFSTHREASIGFIKYVSTGLTLHHIAKKRVATALMKVQLSPDDITTLQEIATATITHNHTNKRTKDGQPKDPEHNNSITFPAFDLSTKRIGFGNGTHRVTTVAYEVKCHPKHSTILKSLLIKASVLDPLPPSDTNIHFIPHGLIQSTDATTVKNQLTQQNRFLSQTGIIPIFNITEDSMHGGTNGIKKRLLDIPSVIAIEPTYLTETSGKWLILVKKSQKDQARRAIDTVISETLFPDSQTERPGRSNRHNINDSLVSYAAALQKESTPSTIQFLQPPQNAYKRHIRASYDIENDTSFPTIENKKKKHSSSITHDTNNTSATASITNVESTTVSTFSHDDFLKMLEKNNTSFKEEIEASFKHEVAEQLQANNDSMMEKINQQFASFQTVMLQTMKELVINMIPQITNQQRSTLLSPSPTDTLNTQPSNYPHH